MSKAKILNYANNDHFQKVLERYGGEEYLKENFPHIRKMLYNTREWHGSKQNETAKEDNENGYTDTFSILELPVSDKDVSNATIEAENNTAVYCDSVMSLVKKQSFLHMSSETSDPKHGKVFGAFSVHELNEHKLNKSLKVDASYLKYSKEPCVQTRTSFAAFSNVDGKSICTVDCPEKFLEIDISEMTEDVTDISVSAPCPKTETDTYIRVVYNGRQDAKAAYNFVKATDRTEGGIRYVKVFYPFSIEVTLDDMFAFDPVNPINYDQNLLISMASSVIKGGEVHYNTAKWENINVSATGNKLTFDFPYSGGDEKNYWYVEMPLTAKQAEGYFDFHLNFSANYGLKDSGTYDFKTFIIVSSEDLPDSPNLEKIKKSKILWGCLGKDTIIKTEKGYKNISEVKVGEKIFTDKGFLAIKNIVTGTEEKIVAVGISDEKTLHITKNHPIATDRGMVRAIDLTISDKLNVEDGTYQDIHYLEVKDYKDKVFSLELEKTAMISADGLMVGDYLTPIPDAVVEEENIEPLEPELVEELKRWSNLKHKQLQKRVNA
jgi:Pretoxin HINT domain